MKGFNFNNLKVTQKFWVVGAIIFPLIGLLGGTGVWGATQINNTLQDVRNNQIPAIYGTSNIVQNIQATQLDITQLLIELDPHKPSFQADKIPNLIASGRDSLAQAQKEWESYKTSGVQPEAAPLMQQFENEWKTWTIEVEAFFKLFEKKVPNLQETALSVFNELTNQNQKQEQILLKLATLSYQSAVEKANNGLTTSQTVIFLVLSTSVLMLLLNFGAAVILSRSISRPLGKLKKATQAIASGDLTQKVEVLSKDEIGELGSTFNLTLVSLRELVQQLYSQSQQVSSATEELTSQARSQVAGSSQQSLAITQATSAIQELKKTADEIMTQALNVKGVVEQSVRQATVVSALAEQMAISQTQGRETVARTIYSLEKLKEQIALIESEEQVLREKSSAVGTVISLIDNIAQETHLLALNATIEAASAGEYGERFGVIAHEVKLLADRSVIATKEVRQTLESIAVLVKQTSQRTKESLLEAEQAVVDSGKSDATLQALAELSEQVRTASRDIVIQVEGSAGLASNIGDSTRQQQLASSEMLNRMMELEAIMAQNLSSIRQGETATYQLSLTAKELAHSADTFILG